MFNDERYLALGTDESLKDKSVSVPLSFWERLGISVVKWVFRVIVLMYFFYYVIADSKYDETIILIPLILLCLFYVIKLIYWLLGKHAKFLSPYYAEFIFILILMLPLATLRRAGICYDDFTSFYSKEDKILDKIIAQYYIGPGAKYNSISDPGLKNSGQCKGHGVEKECSFKDAYSKFIDYRSVKHFKEVNPDCCRIDASSYSPIFFKFSDAFVRHVSIRRKILKEKINGHQVHYTDNWPINACGRKIGDRMRTQN